MQSSIHLLFQIEEVSPSLQVRAKCYGDHCYIPIEPGTESPWYIIFHEIAKEWCLEAMRWMRDNCSFFLPVLAIRTSISFGMSMHQKPFTMVLFGTAWKLKINMISSISSHQRCQENKAIFGIQKIGMNPTWCSRSFLLNYRNWHHTPKTWAQNPYYSIFLGYRMSEFWDKSIFQILS